MECRILTTLKCNLSCKYCINKEMQHTFCKIDASDISKLSMYSAYKISGGEPTMNMSQLDRVVGVLNKFCKPIYLYTNGYFLWKYKEAIATLFDGVNLGVHKENAEYWSNNVSMLKECSASKIHLNKSVVLKKFADKIIERAELYKIPIKYWKIGECNTYEHRFLIK